MEEYGGGRAEAEAEAAQPGLEDGGHEEAHDLLETFSTRSSSKKGPK